MCIAMYQFLFRLLLKKCFCHSIFSKNIKIKQMMFKKLISGTQLKYNNENFGELFRTQSNFYDGAFFAEMFCG